MLWKQRKEALGLEGITNSEFAEILLHQNLDAIRGETHHGQGESEGSFYIKAQQKCQQTG